jgi:CheY-like chemotaxis protein
VVERVRELRPGKRRILVVEDEQEVRMLLQHVLLSAGFAVDVASSVTEALAQLEGHRYHLVLTDDRLPDGRGTRVAEVARERDMDAVVITGYALQSAKQDRERYDYLLKPVRPAELIETIERHLGRDGPGSSKSIA